MKYVINNIMIKNKCYIAIELYNGDWQRLTYMCYHVPEIHIKNIHSVLIDTLSSKKEDTLDQWDMRIHTCIDKTLGYR